LGSLTYDPAANGAGSPYTTFTFQVQDNGGTSNGGIDLDQSANTITFNVTGVNDAPAGTDKTITFNEDTTYTFASGDFGFTDPNDNPANSLQAVKITSLPGAGTLKLGTNAVTAGQTVAAGDLGTLTFQPAANASGTPYTTFTFQVQDSGGRRTWSGPGPVGQHDHVQRDGGERRAGGHGQDDYHQRGRPYTFATADFASPIQTPATR